MFDFDLDKEVVGCVKRRDGNNDYFYGFYVF